MKKLILALTALAFTIPSFARGGHSSHSAGTGSSRSKTHVSGYTKSSGKHVETHNRTAKDHTKTNNWSTKGNVNPETGKAGTK